MRLQFGITLLCLGSAALVASSQASADQASADQPSAKLVAKGDFVAPQFSPDGKRLLITGQRMHGVGEITVSNGDVRWLLDEARVGVHSHYRPDGGIEFRAKRAGKLRSLIIDSQGAISETTNPRADVFAHSDKIYLRTGTGLVKVGSGDRFFAPVLSPDHSKIAFTGLATGVHIYDIATRTQTRVAPGTSPAWSPDSKSLAFERTEDDGHNIVGSEIWIWNADVGARALTRTPALIERHPSWSPDGARLAFDDDNGSIYLVSAAAQR